LSLYHIPTTTGTTGTGNEYCNPFILQSDPNNPSFTTDKVVMDITTLASGGNVQYGLRAPGTGANTGFPGTLLGNTASQSTTTAGVFAVAWTANFPLNTGQGYWLCRQVDNSTVVLEGLTASGGQQVAFIGSTTAAATISTPQTDVCQLDPIGSAARRCLLFSRQSDRLERNINDEACLHDRYPAVAGRFSRACRLLRRYCDRLSCGLGRK
jgi:hypothetical protein